MGDTLEEDVKRELEREPRYARVVTHNAFGEYGHPQHRAIHKAVREAAQEVGVAVEVFQPFNVTGEGEAESSTWPVLLEYGEQEAAAWKHVRARVASLEDFDEGQALAWCTSTMPGVPGSRHMVCADVMKGDDDAERCKWSGGCGKDKVAELRSRVAQLEQREKVRSTQVAMLWEKVMRGMDENGIRAI